MSTAMTLTGKGQFTLNKSLLAHLNVKPGERVIIRKQPDASLRIEAEKAQIDLMSLAGSMTSEVHATLEDIEEAIREGYVNAGMQGLR